MPMCCRTKQLMSNVTIVYRPTSGHICPTGPSIPLRVLSKVKPSYSRAFSKFFFKNILCKVLFYWPSLRGICNGVIRGSFIRGFSTFVSLISFLRAFSIGPLQGPCLLTFSIDLLCVPSLKGLIQGTSTRSSLWVFSKSLRYWTYLRTSLKVLYKVIAKDFYKGHLSRPYTTYLRPFSMGLNFPKGIV